MRTKQLFPLLVTVAGVAGLTPSAPRPIPTPKAKLVWGDVNVLHTTDIHGWMLGHPKNIFPELSWSGTFGDFYSFVNHMRLKAQHDKVDLFLIDTGDRRIGHGLTDKVLTPDSVNGQAVRNMYLDMRYDAIVPGNHDLSTPEVVEYVMKKYADRWGGRYITSNIRRLYPQKVRSVTGEDQREFLGSPYRYWKTPNKNKVLAFGVLFYNARKNDKHISITKVEDMVKEEWFKGALELPTDIFLILGHVDAKDPESHDNMKLVHDAIREKHPGKPILMFGGHSHKRYCERYQTPSGGWRSMILQSGRYFDTVGWMSVQLDNNQPTEDLKMTRRYLDNNIETYKFHTEKNNENFHTRKGQEMTNTAYGIDRSEGLSQVYGYLENNYYLDREHWTEEETDRESLFTLYLDAVQNVLIKKDQSKPWMFFSNWGMVRSDIYEGPFTLGDFFTITPDASDASSYLSVQVERRWVDDILQKTQKARSKSFDPSKCAQSPRFHSRIAGQNSLISQARLSVEEPSTPNDLTYGWVTKDLCGEKGEATDGEGDDVKHENIKQVVLDGSDGCPEKFFWRKSWKGKPEPSSTTMVDLIFPFYIGNRNVRQVLKDLKLEVEPKPYRTDITQNKLLGLYIRENFPKITKNVPFPT